MLTIASGLGTLTILWYFSSIDSEDAKRQARSVAAEPLLPGEPPLDAAACLRLPSEPPQTVLEMNEETLTVGTLLVESLPDRPESHAQLAFAQLQLGRDRAALESWRAALARDENFADAHLGVGVILEEQGDNEAAIASYRRAIELAPDSDHAYRELIEVLLRVGRADEALQVARECVRRFPDVCEHYFWLGQVHLERGDYEAARRSHEEAIRIDPSFPLPYFPLARACVKLGKHEEATRYRERFAELRELELQADRQRNLAYDDWSTQRQRLVKRHVLAGTVQLRFGEPRLAEAHWLRAAAIDPKELPTRKALVSLYRNQGRPGAEVEFLGQLAQLEPDVPEHAMRQGRLLMEMHRWAQAEQVLVGVIGRLPELADAHLLLAELYLRTGIGEKAMAHAEQAVRLSESTQGLLLLAAIHEELGDRPAAISALKRALSLDPKDTRIRETYEQLSVGR